MKKSECNGRNGRCDLQTLIFRPHRQRFFSLDGKEKCSSFAARHHCDKNARRSRDVDYPITGPVCVRPMLLAF